MQSGQVEPLPRAQGNLDGPYIGKLEVPAPRGVRHSQSFALLRMQYIGCGGFCHRPWDVQRFRRAGQGADRGSSRVDPAVSRLLTARTAIEQQIGELDRQVLKLSRQNAGARKFMTVSGIGPITANSRRPLRREAFEKYGLDAGVGCTEDHSPLRERLMRVTISSQSCSSLAG